MADNRSNLEETPSRLPSSAVAAVVNNKSAVAIGRTRKTSDGRFPNAHEAKCLRLVGVLRCCLSFLLAGSSSGVTIDWG